MRLLREIRAAAFASLALLAALCAAGFDNLDYGEPGPCDQVVDREGYALGFVNGWRQPAWVSYRLTRWEAAGGVARSGTFRADPAVAAGSATPADYAGSGYDRGHLSPAADNAWSAAAMSDSFLMSNISPQVPALNRGLWSRIEAAVRNFADVDGSVVVVTGPIVTNGAHEAIGPGRVLVPDGFYKVVYAENYGKMIGFVVWQDSRGTATDFVCPVDEVEALTGLDFFPLIPASAQSAMESECRPDGWCWTASATDGDSEEEWEDYAVDPLPAVPLSAMRRGFCERSWSPDLASLAGLFPRKGVNSAAWTNAVSVPGLQAFSDGTPAAGVSRNLGKATASGFYAFTTDLAAGPYSFGTMTSGSAGRQVFGFAFVNDTRSDVRSLHVGYVGRQFGFGNRTEQSLELEILVTNRLLAVCNGTGWTAPEGASFATPAVGRTDLANGEDPPLARACGASVPVRARPGEFIHVRWRREASTYGAQMGVDGVTVRFRTGGGCLILR